MAITLERIEGHYEAQDVEFGRVYRWWPKCVVVECECGQRLSLTSSMTTCRWCGTDHAAAVREEEVVGHQQLGDEVLHPWRYARDREDVGIPC